MRARRRMVKADEGVRDALGVWWHTCQRSFGNGDGALDRPLSKEEYVSVSRKIYKAMIEEYDEEDAVRSALEDWERDARGEATLSRKLFCDGHSACMCGHPQVAQSTFICFTDFCAVNRKLLSHSVRMPAQAVHGMREANACVCFVSCSVD